MEPHHGFPALREVLSILQKKRGLDAIPSSPVSTAAHTDVCLPAGGIALGLFFRPHRGARNRPPVGPLVMQVKQVKRLDLDTDAGQAHDSVARLIVANRVGNIF